MILLVVLASQRQAIRHMVWLAGIFSMESKAKTGGVEEKRRGSTEECFIGRSSPQHQHDGEEVALEK